MCSFGLSKAGIGRGRHQVAVVHHHRVVVADRHLAVAGDVLVQLHMHQPVFGQRVHAPRLRPARLQARQRLGLRHLIDDDLVLAQWLFGDAVAGLDDASPLRCAWWCDAGGAGEEAADRDRVGGVVGALVDHFQHVGGADDGGGDLDAAGAPAIGQRHFAAAERHLMAGDRHRLENGAADHALGLLVQIGEVVAGVHSAASCKAAASARMRRMLSSSLWKST